MRVSNALFIRPERAADRPAIADVIRRAFKRDEEARLVEALRRAEAFLPDLSLVGVEGEQVIGHLLMSRAHIRADAAPTPARIPALALAPMCVAPDHQNRGVGSALVRDAIERAKGRRPRERCIVVLGHPTYYPRFGFRPASTRGVRPPFDAPDEAFMLLPLEDEAPTRIDGVVEYAAAFASVGDER